MGIGLNPGPIELRSQAVRRRSSMKSSFTLQ